ncbi:asparagine--tRNA ligase [Mangrovivirga sp. M17]|uniref:Asparagine--tRNA ligase n=1 Tax=Mangrovivirga halotolerans TaxID=2993936 RepID=A0ABT3RT34_9BACT|nr:asparagine--tRNA ligase [Mangrovivirga halotolerans]
MDYIRIKELLDQPKTGETVTVKGWVKTRRGSKQVNFIALNDGSTIHNLQIVAETEKFGEELIKKITTGACLSVTGEVVESKGSGQAIEILGENIDVLGESDPEKFPLQPKKHSLEFLREKAHLRVRTTTFGAIYRIRHAMIFAVHKFFNDRGFFNVHTPILTSSDAEGAGEMFRVTTLDPKNPPLTEDGEVDWKEDFFEKQANLTVSGQLEGELSALALGNIYTFGPTFRAENSNTTRHLAEFWMIEPEMAFHDLKDNAELAEDFLKYLVNYALENCEDDLNFLAKREEDENKNKPANERPALSLLERLKMVRDNDFAFCTYTEAIDILKNSKPNKKKKFNYPVDEWGVDMQSEHEKYLVEKHFKKPVIVTDYPKDIKAFYMRVNDDNKTVAAMDILFPGIGEIVGGSQREERMDILTSRMKDFNIEEEHMQWYLDTRRFGSCVHSGFGLGFERLMLFVTGMTNIRDVIPFPRTPGNCEF